ncbi:MAG: rhomboid family intramembrane serine protease [Dethiobacter sp.]|nr:MAG: rhomboid family intramembrane serine protease [Dethiobacter sp.]
MIPLRDSIRPQKYPYVNILLIFLNIAIFIYQLSLTETALMEFFYRYGVIPEKFLLLQGNDWFPLLSSMFLHGGWFHLLGNMLYLWVFGDNIEDRLGHSGYLFFYLVAGIAASLSHIIANPQSPIPTIGASGAVAGVLGAYFILFPRSKVLTLIPIGFFITTAHLPAVLFLFLWFFLQLFNALVTGVTAATQMVAWWAHIGGFVLGILVGAGKLLHKKLS